MLNKTTDVLMNSSPYRASFTREQFLFHETRITAGLMCEGLSEEEIIARILQENLLQYPAEKSVKRIALACLHRLKAMENDALVQALVSESSQTAKQICLYAMMKQYRMVWDFMITVIGEKYRLKETAFGRMDFHIFFIRLQEQDSWVAAWSDSTVSKLKQVLARILVENEYLDTCRADHLNPIWLNPVLEQAIRSNHDEAALPAFNCFSLG